MVTEKAGLVFKNDDTTTFFCDRMLSWFEFIAKVGSWLVNLLRFTTLKITTEKGLLFGYEIIKFLGVVFLKAKKREDLGNDSLIVEKSTFLLL